MTQYDYLVIAVYFAFMFAISWATRRVVGNISDYFRSGGKVLWWVAGASAFMTSFSAYMFTGGAGKAYSDGWTMGVVFVGWILGFLLCAGIAAARLRQMRAITPLDGVRSRFGPASEQFFAWIQIPFGILTAGIWLDALGVFLAAAFNLDLTTVIIGTGIVVLIASLIGGSWAVIVSDFIQLVLLIPVAIVITVLGVAYIGGPAALIDGLPAGHLDFSRAFGSEFVGLWCIGLFLRTVGTSNCLWEAGRYLCVKDGRHARRAAILGAALFVVGAVVFLVPPLVSAVVFPDLAQVFPNLRNPNDAAYVAIAQKILPVGMMGLLVCGIFAATMSSMDTGLNRIAAIFVKNFYLPVCKPNADDARLLGISRLCTVVIGALIIVTAWRMSELHGVSLFSLMVGTTALIGLPVIVPLIWGMFVRNTPSWSGWATVLVGYCSSLFATYFLTPDRAASWLGLAEPMSALARENWSQGIAMVLNIVVGTAFFFFTKLFWTGAPATDKERIGAFFATMERPVDFEKEEGANNDSFQAALLGRTCLAYGAFICLLAFIPNPAGGRLAFLFCGGLVGALGWLVLKAHPRRSVSAPPGTIENRPVGIAS